MINRNRRIRALALLTLGTTASFGLLADGGERPKRGPVSISDMQIRLDERFNAIDTDNSETLSLEEYLAVAPQDGRDGRPAHRGKFRDGKRTHWGNRDSGGNPEREFDREAFEAAVFTAMDTDGDGKLSAEEAGRENRKAASRRVMRESRFERLDSNADGLLDRTEFNAPVLRLTAADRDSDGYVSREEMQAARENQRS